MCRPPGNLGGPAPRRRPPGHVGYSKRRACPRSYPSRCRGSRSTSSTRSPLRPRHALFELAHSAHAAFFNAWDQSLLRGPRAAGSGSGWWPSGRSRVPRPRGPDTPAGVAARGRVDLGDARVAKDGADRDRKRPRAARVRLAEPSRWRRPYTSLHRTGEAISIAESCDRPMDTGLRRREAGTGHECACGERWRCGGPTAGIDLAGSRWHPFLPARGARISIQEV